MYMNIVSFFSFLLNLYEQEAEVCCYSGALISLQNGLWWQEGAQDMCFFVARSPAESDYRSVNKNRPLGYSAVF